MGLGTIFLPCHPVGALLSILLALYGMIVTRSDASDGVSVIDASDAGRDSCTRHTDISAPPLWAISDLEI